MGLTSIFQLLLESDMSAAMGGANPMYPGSGSIGSGSVVRPSYHDAAKAWQQEPGGTKDRLSWDEYAKRMGLWPEDIEKGWSFLAGSVRESFHKLGRVLCETTEWGGYALPIQALQPPPHTPSSVPDAPGFGFHTATAEKVWATAKRIAQHNPKASTDSIISQAVADSKVLALDMTPEDQRMLEMAINWYITGKHWNSLPPSNIVIGGGAGSPGGPMRSTGMGHELAGAGAP